MTLLIVVSGSRTDVMIPSAIVAARTADFGPPAAIQMGRSEIGGL